MASSGTPNTAYTGGRDHSDDLIAVIGTQWNADIVGRLVQGCLESLGSAGVRRIVQLTVPGSYELPQAAAHLLGQAKFDAIICLGCIIKGETRHDQFIAQSVASALQNLALMSRRPVIFGVLTTEDQAQAEARAGGSHGHKGIEAAQAALAMIDLWKTSTDTIKAVTQPADAPGGSARTPGQIGFGR